MTDETTTTKKAGLSPIEVGAGAGAAVITAFASSYLGTAGTLTGAAVASVLGTVSTSVLRSSAQTSTQRLKEKTAQLRETRVGQTGVTDVRPVEAEDIDPYGTQLFGVPNWIDPEAPTGARPAEPGRTAAGPLGADAEPDETTRLRTGTGQVWPDGTRPLGSGSEPGSAWGAPTERLDGRTPGPAGPGGSGREAGTGPGRRVRPRWVVLGAGAVAAFALALGAITGIEAAAGKPLSGLAGQESGGGTTLGRATGSDGGSGSGRTSTPTPTPTTTGDASSSGTESASPGAGATSPSGGLSGTAPAPSATSPSAVPSATQPAPTQAPSQSPNP
jgi:hypothetical protein